MTFEDPAAGGDRLNPRDILGHLLIVHPIEYCTGIITQYSGPEGSDAVKADIADLDAFNADGTNIWRGVLWFQGQLISSLKPKIGKLVLGRMGKGMGQPGRNQPFVIEPASGDAMAVSKAQVWLATHPEFTNVQGPPPTPQPQATPQQQQTVLDRLRQQGQQGYTPGNGTTQQGSFQYQQNPPF